jgi:hypothetical protein
VSFERLNRDYVGARRSKELYFDMLNNWAKSTSTQVNAPIMEKVVIVSSHMTVAIDFREHERGLLRRLTAQL